LVHPVLIAKIGIAHQRRACSSAERIMYVAVPLASGVLPRRVWRRSARTWTAAARPRRSRSPSLSRSRTTVTANGETDHDHGRRSAAYGPRPTISKAFMARMRPWGVGRAPSLVARERVPSLRIPSPCPVDRDRRRDRDRPDHGGGGSHVGQHRAKSCGNRSPALPSLTSSNSSALSGDSRPT
jgi:hypothetical protein